MSEFGNILASPEDRSARIKAATDRATCLGSHFTLHDIEPTEHPRVFRTEWLRPVAGESVICSGYIAIYTDRWRTEREYHCASFDAAVEYLNTNHMPMERLKALVHGRDRFSRTFAKALGWCDPGINTWISAHLAGRDLSDDSVDVRDLWKAIGDSTDYYAATLRELLQDHPRIDRKSVV